LHTCVKVGVDGFGGSGCSGKLDLGSSGFLGTVLLHKKCEFYRENNYREKLSLRQTGSLGRAFRSRFKITSATPRGEISDYFFPNF
jgi:hypothetical protein